MPLTEVAATLGIPIGTVKSRLHRALGEMRIAVEAEPTHPVAGSGRAGRMTTPMRRERDLSPILTDLAMAPYPDYVDDVLGRTGRMRQRPAWTFPGRWLPMDLTTRAAPVARLPWRQLGVLALIALLLATALAVYVGTQRHVPAPFGPARNGLIPYISGGDIYVGDPVTGRTTLLLGGPGGRLEPRLLPRRHAHRVHPFRSGRRGAPAAGRPVRHARRWQQRHEDHVGVAAERRCGRVGHPMAGGWPSSIRPTAGTSSISSMSKAGCRPSGSPPPPAPIRWRSDRRTVARPCSAPWSMARYGLFVMNADGTNVRTLVKPTNTADLDQDLNAATYSADGSRIFYQRWFPDSIQLWVMNADGTGAHEFLSKSGSALGRHRPTIARRSMDRLLGRPGGWDRRSERRPATGVSRSRRWGRARHPDRSGPG